MSDMVHIKEEQMDAPPGFTTPPENVSFSGCATTSTPSSAAAATPNCSSSDDQLGFQDPFQSHTGHMQNSIECMQKEPDPWSTNLADYLKRNRKRDEFPGHRVDPFPRRRRARTELHLTPEAHGSNLQCDFNRTIASLNAKHGAIDKDCNLSSEWMKKLNLFGIWRLLKDLHNKKLEELELCSLQPYYDLVEDAEKMNIKMKWLLERLDEIKDAIISRNTAKVLEAVRNDHIQKREEKKEMLKRLQMEVKKTEDEMRLDNEAIEELDGEINNRVSKFQSFQCRPLLDGLI